jgi:MFS family permease
MTMRSYVRVLASAALCYAALGAVLRILPDRMTALHASSFAVGLAVGAPALSGVFFRPLGGRLADGRGPAAIVLAGALIMSLGVAPAVFADPVAQIGSRLVVGAGEGLMMAAAVLWLLRIGGPERRGRALGHIGLANYGGLAVGPLLADALHGGAHPGRVLAAAAILPLAGAASALGIERPAGVPEGESPHGTRALARSILLPGLGLMLVNFGYIALLSFGTRAAAERGVAGASLVVPVFALTVIVARTAGGSIPDKVGASRTLVVAAPLAGLGLLGAAHASGTVTLVAAVIVLAAGQALAVPALGLLALAGAPPEQHGAAAGLFFAFFDAGVGLGGPAAGALAGLTSASGALSGAAPAVALAAPLALVARRGLPLRPLVD